jgi:hypothetical protein
MTHDDFDDSDEAAQHDIRFYDLIEAAFPSPPLPDQHARALRMAKRLKLRVLEWSGSRERVYFAQEFVNGLEE